MKIPVVVQTLQSLAPQIHQTITYSTGRRGKRAEQTHGLCDLMTALAMKLLDLETVTTTAFVGIQIPRRKLGGRQTHTSHTLGVVHGFAGDERDHAIIFDYACAQYGYEQDVYLQVTAKEDVYHDLRRTYGGGIWQPGGCWLSQIDVDEFLRLYQSL